MFFDTIEDIKQVLCPKPIKRKGANVARDLVDQIWSENKGVPEFGLLLDITTARMCQTHGEANGITSSFTTDNTVAFVRSIHERSRVFFLNIFSRIVPELQEADLSGLKPPYIIEFYVRYLFSGWYNTTKIRVYPVLKSGNATCYYLLLCSLLKQAGNEFFAFKINNAALNQSRIKEILPTILSDLARKVFKLSPKEYLLLSILAYNLHLTNADLAKRFDNSITTINKHTSNIVSKINRQCNLCFKDVRDVAIYLLNMSLI